MVRVSHLKMRALNSHFGVRLKEKYNGAVGATWRKYKMADSQAFSADSRAIMKGAIHEEAFNANFPGGDTGDWRHVCSCHCDQTKGQRDVRNHLYRSQAQLSRRLFL